MIKKICRQCLRSYEIPPSRGQKSAFCSYSCRSIYTGFLRRQRAKPRLSTQGYFFIKQPDYHRANKQGYAKVCDMVAEKKMGKKLLPDEVVHHLNRIRTDDRPENLQVLTKSDHSKLHCLLNKQDGKYKLGSRAINWKKLDDKDIYARFKNNESLRSIAKIYEVKHSTIKLHIETYEYYQLNSQVQTAG